MVSEVADSGFQSFFCGLFLSWINWFVGVHVIGPTLSVIAEHQFFPLPEPLQLSIGNSSQNWKRFKQKMNNYELATGVADKDDAIRVATI